ncbi:MAG: DNA polymerase III subunit alpha [Gammaproteobacteria bacterium]|nr:DNA polymerase III subunit alpha [Gammaproteobacteria bacterium]
MTSAFVHLHLHTEYSLVDSTIRIKSLMQSIAAMDSPAVALTDQSNLFAMVKFYRAAMRAGVKPIIGVDVWAHHDDSELPSRLVLLCRNEVGYRNLTRLVTRSFREGQHAGRAIIQQSWFDGSSDGLIALSGGREGDVGRALLAGNNAQALEYAQRWTALFPESFFIELQRTGRAAEEPYIHAAVDLAEQCQLPIVATNDVVFLQASDFESHEARVCITDGRTLSDPRRPHNYSDQQYLRTAEEMAELFSDLPEALDNTLRIAEACNLDLVFGKSYLPDFPVPDGQTMDSFFREKSEQGLALRLERILDSQSANYAEQKQEYLERLELELGVIMQMGFPGYFLIVADFIQWAKDNDIPVGPGRGSGAGSLVAYSLKITDIDPMEFELLFERFLNPERVSMPDFDIDFCMENRDRVIEYVSKTYGRNQVSQIITYGSMAAKAVVRDVGRVLGQPYGFVDRIAKLIPFEVGITLEQAMEQEKDLKTLVEEDEEAGTLMELALSLEGLARNAGKHAGGVVIAPTDLTDFTPLYCEQGGQGLVTQFDKDDVEAIGLVKFDFLGLRTLTIIDWAVKAINKANAKSGGEIVDIDRIPMDDVKAFKLLKAYQTTAVFQLESRGMKDLIKRLQPDCFEDIIALVALFRPGPLQSGMVDDFINRKHGRQRVEYPHPKLEPILKPTYGVILYQEQVMQIAQVMSGATLGGADMLRRAMGKKKPEEMAKQRILFEEGAKKEGIDANIATHVFDLMEHFAGYGFNKSHSAAYALVSYQTAWLKSHYPSEFMAAVLSADMDNTDKIVTLIDECRELEIPVLSPDVNRSLYRFAAVRSEAEDNGSIVYGLGAIKGVGEAAIEGLLKARDGEGAFKDLDDFCRRVDLQKANKRVMEALVRSGALDPVGHNRATLLHYLPEAIRAAEQHLLNVSRGQNDLFDSVESIESSPDQQVLDEWDEPSRLLAEKESLGLYLTGHPVNRYRNDIHAITEKSIKQWIAQLETSSETKTYGSREQDAVVAGLVVAIRLRNTQRGREAFVTLDDRTGRVDVRLFPEDYERYEHLIQRDHILVVDGGIRWDDFSGGVSMKAKQVCDIEQARQKHARRLFIKVDKSLSKNGFLQELCDILSPFREGKTPVVIGYANTEAEGKIKLGAAWHVQPTDELLQRLSGIVPEDNVQVQYD